MTSVNLMPSSRLLARRRRRVARRWLVGGAFYAAGLGLAMLIARNTLSAGAPRLDALIARCAADLLEKEQSQQVLQRETAKLAARWDARRAVADQPDWSLLLAILADIAGDGVVVRGVTLQRSTPVARTSALALPGAAPAARSQGRPPHAVTLRIEGLGRTQKDASAFALGLEKLNLFDHVRLTETTRDAQQGMEVVRFELVCALGSEGGP